MSVGVIATAHDFRRACQEARTDGELALVPTMGYLHGGHQSLIQAAALRAPTVAVTIFVNPTQFGPAEDLSRYPRNIEGDLRKCEQAGATFVFAPKGPEEMYPPGFQTWVEPGPLAVPLEGEKRPGHFRGVVTIVTKFFALSRADCAFFGEKDYQQLLVIRRMNADLNLGVEVIGRPIMRESDGLAMSSRNAYLSPDERARATALWRRSRPFAMRSRPGRSSRRRSRSSRDRRCSPTGCGSTTPRFAIRSSCSAPRKWTRPRDCSSPRLPARPG